jgi:hypothetical protein
MIEKNKKYDTKQVSKYLSFHEATIRKIAKDYKWKIEKIGRKHYYKGSDIIDTLNACTVPAESADY